MTFNRVNFTWPSQVGRGHLYGCSVAVVTIGFQMHFSCVNYGLLFNSLEWRRRLEYSVSCSCTKVGKNSNRQSNICPHNRSMW